MLHEVQKLLHKRMMSRFKVVILLMTLLPVILAQTSLKTSSAPSPVWSKDELLSLSDKCFCKLEGHIDDCSCKVNTVDDFNNKKIYPRVKSLVSKDFFRYFQYQPNKKCLFWDSSSGKCASTYCQVKQCPTTDLPPGFMEEAINKGHDKYSEEANKNPNCDKDYEDFQDEVDDTISESVSKDLKNWKQHDDAENNFCELDSDRCQDCVHVDLTKNPERNISKHFLNSSR